MSVESRLVRLERSNRQLKVSLVVTLGCLGLFVLVGAAGPPPKAIFAQRFVVVNPDGRARADLSANEKSSALQLLNQDGSRGVTLGTGSTDNGLFIADVKGGSRINFLASGDQETVFAMTRPGTNIDRFKVRDSPDGTALTFRDGNGKDRATVGAGKDGEASLAIADANDTIRAGVASEGFMTFEKSGQVDWASLGAKMTPEELKRVMNFINSSIEPRK